MTLSYADIGNQTDPPLIFIHGLGSSSKQITSVLTDLGPRRLIAPNMPGHGDSLDFDPALFSFDYFADLVIDLLDSLGIESTDLGGLSMGSGIALNIALRYPDRVKKIVVLRPSWMDSVQPTHLSLVARVGQWIDAGDDDEKATMKLALDSDYQDLAAKNVSVAESVTALLDRPRDPASIGVLYKMWQNRPFSDLKELSKIANPALVLDTTRDELHPQSTATAIAQHLSNASAYTLPPRYYDAANYKKELHDQLSDFLG